METTSTSDPMEETRTDNNPRVVDPSPIRATCSLIFTRDSFNQIMQILKQLGDTENATLKTITEADNVKYPHMSQYEVICYLSCILSNPNKVSPPTPLRSPWPLLCKLKRILQSVEVELEAARRKLDNKCLKYIRLHDRRPYLHNLRQRRILASMVNNSSFITKAVWEAIWANEDNRGEDYRLRMKEVENFLLLQTSYLQQMRRLPRRTPYSSTPFPPQIDDDNSNVDDEDLCQRLADVLSVKDDANTPDPTRASSGVKSDLCGETVEGEERRGRGGPMRRRRGATRLIDVDNMVANLRDLTL